MAIAVGPSVAFPPRQGRRPPEGRHRSCRNPSSTPSPVAASSGFQSPTALLAMARRLALWAPSWPGMQRPARRHWDLMAASDLFEAWVIAWPPGGAIELHDHGGSAGAVVVVAGELIETTRRVGAFGETSPSSPKAVGVGGSISFGGHHIHDVVNSGDAPAISVHVYAPRLNSMTYYRMADRRLEAGATVQYRFGQAVA